MTLETLLERDDWTEGRLAALVGVGQSTINRLRRRKRTASVGLAMRIERATDGLVQAHELPLCEQACIDLQLLRPDAASPRSAA